MTNSRKYIPVSGKVFDQKEIDNAIKVARDGWWTEGEFAKIFETKFKQYLKIDFVTLVNSGSSANLLAVAALTADIWGKRTIKPGDEFITVAASFPTTVSPGIVYGLKAVFVDVDLDTLNINVDELEKAITPKTKLIMIAHTLGKPFDIERIKKICQTKKIWLIEDCCDALGTKYKGKMVGTWGDMATYSFYPAHQITMGEGGAIVTNNPLIHKTIRQFRDWGRDCWCDTGKDDTCKKRFDWKQGELPEGYDHKYIYSQVGFNLKLTDFQAAIGVAQLEKLEEFIKSRKRNYRELYKHFQKYPDYFLLMRENPDEDISYFGFPLVVKNNSKFSRNDFSQYLEKEMIGTRNVFSGNLLKHPAYLKIKHKYKIVGNLKNTDRVMNQAMWIGVYPKIDLAMIDYIKKTVDKYINQWL